MRAGKETHEQTRMQTGDLEDPTADKEIKPPRLADEVSRPAPTAGTINPASIKKPPVENTRTTINQTPMQDEDEWGRRILDFSDPPNPFQKAWPFLKNTPTHCPIHGDELQMIGDPALDDEIGPSWCPTCAELPKNEMGEQEASVLGER
jgi:hypothetical protein